MGWCHPTMPVEEAFRHLSRDLEMIMSKGWLDFVTTLPRQMQLVQMIRWHLLNRASRVGHPGRALELAIQFALQFWHSHMSSAPGYIPSGRESSPCTVRDQN